MAGGSGDAFMHDPDPALARRELTLVFTYMNVVTAICAFERTFTVLHRHRPRTLRFEEVDSTNVGADEARLLGSLACLQRGDPHTAMGVLGQAMTRFGVHSILPPLARIAAILDVQGHRLPAWRCVSGRATREPGTRSSAETFSPPLYPAR